MKSNMNFARGQVWATHSTLEQRHTIYSPHCHCKHMIISVCVCVLSDRLWFVMLHESLGVVLWLAFLPSASRLHYQHSLNCGATWAIRAWERWKCAGSSISLMSSGSAGGLARGEFAFFLQPHMHLEWAQRGRERNVKKKQKNNLSHCLSK